MLNKKSLYSAFRLAESNARVNSYIENMRNKKPIINTITITTAKLLLLVFADFEFNEEAIRYFLRKVKNWKALRPDLTESEIAQRIINGEQAPRKKRDWGKLEKKL